MSEISPQTPRQEDPIVLDGQGSKPWMNELGIDLRQVDNAISNARMALQAAAHQYIHLLSRAPSLYIDGNFYAYTDGIRITFGRKFLSMTRARTDAQNRIVLGAQEFAVAHEIMHMARCHSDRILRMRTRAVGYDPEIGNIVADAFVNEDILHWQPVRFPVPEWVIRWQSVVDSGEELAKAANVELPEALTLPIYESSFEEIHDIMLALTKAANKNDPKGTQQAIQKCLGYCPPGPGNQPGQPDQKQEEGSSPSPGGSEASEGEKDQQNQEPGPNQQQSQEQNHQPGCSPATGSPKERGSGIPSLADVMRASVAKPEIKITVTDKDLVPPPYQKSTSEDQQQRDAFWRAAINQASKTPGTQPGDGVLRLSKAKPIQAPWHKKLENMLKKHLVPNPGRSLNKPSNDTITCYAAGPPFWPGAVQPGLTHYTPGGTLVFCIDTSGSMEDEILIRAARHLKGMCKRWESPIHVVTCDHEVQQVWKNANDLPRTIQKIIKEGLKGRGGTAFEPGIAMAKELKADLLLYITDGYAHFPKKPKEFPVVWARTPSALRKKEFPWGKIIEMD